jgi:hypothetical protein
VSEYACVSSYNIKDYEFKMSDMLFEDFSIYPQEVKVSEQMHDASVQKNACDWRQYFEINGDNAKVIKNILFLYFRQEKINV